MTPTANNLIWWRALGTIHSPQDPDPAKRYKSFGGRVAGGAPARRGSFSPDGINWEAPSASGDIRDKLTESAESQNVPGDVFSDDTVPVCYDELSGRYVDFPKVIRKSGKHDRRSVAVSFSDDFLTWTPVQTILVPDERDDELARERIAALHERVEYDDGLDWQQAQLYGHCGFPYEGMYLGMLWVFGLSGWGPKLVETRGRKPGAGGEDGLSMLEELTSSRDLLNWDRVCDRNLLFPVSPVGSFDAGRLHTINRPLIVGDEIWIYYCGLEQSHGSGNFSDDYLRAHSKAGIGLANLRLDGWVSVDADDSPGTLTTKPLTFTGANLQINAAVTKGGQVAVEILDETGQPMPGFTRSDCQPFTGDSVRHHVTWQEQPGLSRLEGKPLRLRFHLKKAKFYSFVFK